MKLAHRILLPACAVGALLLTGCKGAASVSEAKAKEAKPWDAMSIRVTADVARHIRTGKPQMSPVAAILDVAGRVEADENRIARVNSPVSGRIVDLEVVEGQTVKRGQVVAVIRSTELTSAQTEFLKAHSQRRLAEKAVDRAKRLLDAGVIGEAELQRREAELVQATAEVSSSRDQLAVLGMTEEALDKLQTSRTINSLFQVQATIDGTVLERKATIGQVVQDAEVVCVLSDLSKVWLVADLPEQSAGTIDVGKSVEAQIPALPGQTFHGKLTFVSATVNPETRTVRIRMDVPNPRGKLKPAMLATMLLKDESQKQMLVPSTAVVREGNQDHLYVEAAQGVFAMRPVQLAGEFEKSRVVVSGLTGDETIVLDGAFHLNNERKRLALQGE
ncbi:efflux RND transporter periplasmic adaptor subunit [Paludibaculum fermentans]|uniref:Efflux RND transporter periplasmic adaptor subunit n=1 Tax=Paludibaculum fermentans TaxID=1473598 RepID=A0A7S7NM93_PALFE|nr:efflux RND transporter periplasmic adaptor subunit [Paludibaculum fermentans]QOY86238.1 efflux RND transporter periplasmic adaptor subunit [Paludibaculum fermentans]